MNTPSRSKPRRDNRLANLPPEDQQRLDHWLADHTYPEVLDLARQPRPEGLALRTSRSVLIRFHHRNDRAQILSDLKDTQALVRQLLPASRNVAQLNQVALRLVFENVLTQLLDPELSASEHARLSGLILRLNLLQRRERRDALQEKDQALREERTQIARDRLTFALGKAIRERYPQIDDSDYDDLATDQERFELVASRMYNLGPDPRDNQDEEEYSDNGEDSAVTEEPSSAQENKSGTRAETDDQSTPA